jgi:hypothetical protein
MDKAAEGEPTPTSDSKMSKSHRDYRAAKARGLRVRDRRVYTQAINIVMLTEPRRRKYASF